jgi:6-phospho-beta-glucosidase
MKLALIGGGGFRTPLVYGALLDRDVRIDDLVLYDVELARLVRISSVLEGFAAERGVAPAFRLTEDLDDAVEGADVVFCAIRVGGLEARVIDEVVPLAEGVLGQETVGPGGIAFALRTVPVMRSLAERVAERAPKAWFVNFTNPAGLVVEALQPILGTRAVGICDGPESLFRGVARALGRRREDLWFDYFGLNHLGWLRSVRDAEGDLLPELLASDERLASFPEGRIFGADYLRAIGLIPMEYLWYFLHADEAVAAHRAGGTRAELLLEQQTAFYAGGDEVPAEALASWRAALGERNATYMAEAGKPAAETGHDAVGYEHAALDVLEAVNGTESTALVVNTTNRGSMPFLDDAAVVEVPCTVGPEGVSSLEVGAVPQFARELIEEVKAAERLTIEAAVTRSEALAECALAAHPLVPSAETARRILDGYRASVQKNSHE